MRGSGDRGWCRGLGLCVALAACGDDGASDDGGGPTSSGSDVGPTSAAADTGPATTLATGGSDDGADETGTGGPITCDDDDDAGSTWTNLRLIDNADFELGREPAAGWTIEPGSEGAVAWTDGRSGRGLLVDDAATDLGASVLSSTLAVEPGETIQLEAWAEVLEGDAGTLYLEFRDDTLARLEPSVVSADADPRPGWHPIHLEATAPVDAHALTMRLYSKQAAVGATRWDDVRVTSEAPGGYEEPLGPDVVLFVADHRMESRSGVHRALHPGEKIEVADHGEYGPGVVFAREDSPWAANPRLAGTVLHDPDTAQWRMWFTAAGTGTPYATGYATSDDGLAWTDHGMPVFDVQGPGGVVQNPSPTGPRLLMLYSDSIVNDDAGSRRYLPAGSDDGIAWDLLGGDGVPGWDVVNVSYDPHTEQYLAMAKPWGAAPLAARDIHLSTSTDFIEWSEGELVFEADARDLAFGAAEYGAQTADVYGMAAIRRGDQVLGIPWMFFILDEHPTNPGQDTGPSRLTLASSRDLRHWSRPIREPLIVPSAPDNGNLGWDAGFNVGGTTFVDVGEQTRFYYGSFNVGHATSSPQFRGSIGFAQWPRDRFVSWSPTDSAGVLTTRTLRPEGDTLHLNAANANVCVEVLDADGQPVPGWTLDDCIPTTVDDLDHRVAWTDHDTLPCTRPLRLRFVLETGELFAWWIDDG